jgi:uncharacterized protein YacL
MVSLLKKYPIIYLVCCGFTGLIAGVEIGIIIKNGLSVNTGELYLSIFTIIVNLMLAATFIYIYLKITRETDINKKVSQMNR